VVGHSSSRCGKVAKSLFLSDPQEAIKALHHAAYSLSDAERWDLAVCYEKLAWMRSDHPVGESDGSEEDGKRADSESDQAAREPLALG
jgi:hypothetical protein